MLSIDLNCDLGEGMGNDEALMQFISSANIACGYHAGDVHTMQRTVEYALQHHVAIGAHPGFADKEHFGRIEQVLPPEAYYDLVTQQLFKLQNVVSEFGSGMHHVKPHGALYNMAAKDRALAAIIAKAVKDFDPSLVLYGLSGSYSISEANAIGLRTASEVFADRTYTDEGRLTARNQPNALIEDIAIAVRQVLHMVREQSVVSVNRQAIPIVAETICIHGDGLRATEFAKHINEALKENHIAIKAI